MNSKRRKDAKGIVIILAFLIMIPGIVYAQEPSKSSYSPVVIQEMFQDVVKRMKAAKPEVMKRQMDLLNQRYDLSDHPADGVMMSGGKSLPRKVFE